MAQLLLGRPVAQALGHKIERYVKEWRQLGRIPRLATVRVGQRGDDVAYEGRKDVFCKRGKLSVGAEYIPNPIGRNYLSRVKYRVGGYYSKPYYKINGMRAATEFGLSAGFGLPVPMTRSLVSVSAQYVRTQGSHAAFLDENTLRICIGITFNERWFFKRKVN